MLDHGAGEGSVARQHTPMSGITGMLRRTTLRETLQLAEHTPVLTSHTRTVLSRDPEQRVVLSSESAIPEIES